MKYAMYALGLIVLNSVVYAFASSFIDREIFLDIEKEGRRAILKRYELGYDNERFIGQLQEKLIQDKERSRKADELIAELIKGVNKNK